MPPGFLLTCAPAVTEGTAGHQKCPAEDLLAGTSEESSSETLKTLRVFQPSKVQFGVSSGPMGGNLTHPQAQKYPKLLFINVTLNFTVTQDCLQSCSGVQGSQPRSTSSFSLVLMQEKLLREAWGSWPPTAYQL